MIESRRNETLKGIRRLRGRQGDHALVEGPKLVAEAIECGAPIETLLLSPDLAATPAGARLTSLAPRPPLLVDGALLAELGDADSPRGALAVVRLPRGGAETLPVAPDALYLYLDRVQDPGNLGAVARVAEAFGAVGLALAPGSAHPNHPRALRGSAGSLLRLPTARDVEPAALDRRLAPARPLWVALATRGGEALPRGRPAGPLVLALGAEGSGLSPPLERRADRRWSIPLAAPVESLNVAVAAAVALFALQDGRVG